MSTTIIRQPEELDKLLRGSGLRFALELDELGPANGAWEKRLRKEYDECGCAAGAIGLLVGIAVGAFVMGSLSATWWQVSLSAVISGIGLMICAKLLRVSVSRSKLQVIVREIQARVKQQRSNCRDT
jgi:hypothetical protein